MLLECMLLFSSKVKVLDEELRVVTNTLKSLEISDEKVRLWLTLLLHCIIFV